MPAGSEPEPLTLPRTYRPLGVRLAALVLGALLLLTVVVVWLAFPQDVRDQFSWLQRGTVIVFGLLVAAAGYALARSRIDASADGLVVVNGYRSRRYDWNEVLAVSLRSGSPWATLDLSDGTSVPAMGIQGSDGSRAVGQVRQLRRLVSEQSSTELND